MSRNRLLVVLAVTLVPQLAAAQGKTVQGRVLAGSQPVPNQPVTLHRVTSTGGETLSTDTTDAQGRFTLSYTPGADAIHFGATRYQEQLYIGETFRDAPLEPDYTIAVGPGATPIDMGPPTAAPPAAAAAPPDDAARKAGIMIVAVVTLVAAGIIAFALSRRRDPMRRVLIEVADLDNRHAESPIADYQTQRAELLRRLRETA